MGYVFRLSLAGRGQASTDKLEFLGGCWGLGVFEFRMVSFPGRDPEKQGIIGVGAHQWMWVWVDEMGGCGEGGFFIGDGWW